MTELKPQMLIEGHPERDTRRCAALQQAANAIGHEDARKRLQPALGVVPRESAFVGRKLLGEASHATSPGLDVLSFPDPPAT